ncbi:MAG: cytochrome C [Campylobacterales bacterium]|nr:cytochrome C [Campylobacterales bacterium]
MKNILKLVMAAVLLLGLSTVTASASVAKGQKLYQKKLKSACGFTGAAMAGKHSQDEWEAFHKSGLDKEIRKLCPSVKDKSLKGKYLPHYFDFFYEYANDSGNVPSC